MDFEYILDGILRSVSLNKKGDIYLVQVGESTQEADIRRVSPNVYSLKLGDRSVKAYVARDKDRLYVQVGGASFILSDPVKDRDGFETGGDLSQSDARLIRSPMPGKVIKVNVSAKDKVRKNQTLAIVEAMKMENEIKATIDGVVKTIFCQPGDLVETENPLIELE